jgi:hypothetical protein
VYPLVSLVLAAIVALLPLAIYFFLLARIYQRNTPTLVPANTELAYTLFGVSGFLLLLPFVFVPLLAPNFQEFAFGGHFSDMTAKSFVNAVYVPLGLSIVYWLMLAFLIGFAGFVRRKRTLLLHCPADLAEALVQQHLEGRLMQGRNEDGLQPFHPNVGDKAIASYVIRKFQTLENATIYWHGPLSSAWLTKTEAELQASVNQASVPANPLSQWYRSLFSALIMVVCLWAGFVTLLILRIVR